MDAGPRGKCAGARGGAGRRRVPLECSRGRPPGAPATTAGGALCDLRRNGARGIACAGGAVPPHRAARRTADPAPRPPDAARRVSRPFRAAGVAMTVGGFVWDARIRVFPGVVVRVCDSFIAGAGSTRASAMGIVPLIHIEGTPEIAAGALLRYLAEA